MKKGFKSELKTVIKIAKWEYALKLFTSIVMRATLLIIPILFSSAINSITLKNTKMTIVMICLSAALVLLYRFFEAYNQVAYYKLYNKLFNHYNKEAVSLTKDNSIFSLSRFSPGEYTNMVITDVDIISGFFATSVIRVVQLSEFLVIFIYFYTIDVYIFFATLFITIFMIIGSLKFGNKLREYNQKRKFSLDRMTSSAYDYFFSIKEIKEFNIFNKIYPLIEDKRGSYLTNNADYNIKYNFNNSASLFLFEICRLLAVLYVGIRVIHGHLDVGAVLVIYNYYQKIIDNFLIVLTFNLECRNVSVSIQRLNRIKEYSNHSLGNLIVKKDDVKGKIEFKNVLYGFKNDPILDHISFKIPSNSITVLAGNNENVNEAIFDLLLRLNRQHEGDITIDSIDIKEICENDYFDLVSSIRKQTVFFDIPIKDNFTMINEDFDKVVQICKLVGLDDEIRSLPKGYNTIVDDNTKLSRSAKKMLVIVRMLIKESKVLLLDDVTNVLDAKHEKLLMNLLLKMKKDHTILMVTHSKKVIDRADYVLDIGTNYVSKMKKRDK